MTKGLFRGFFVSLPSNYRRNYETNNNIFRYYSDSYE